MSSSPHAADEAALRVEVRVDRPAVTARQHRHRAVLGGGVVQQQAHREHVVVGVRIEGGVLVHLDRRADVAALEVQLAVVEADATGPISSLTMSRIGDSSASQR